MKSKSLIWSRALALLLVFATLISFAVMEANAASIQDGAQSASMTLGHRETILETTAGTKLRACAYSYTTDNGLTGVGYCVNHGLDFTDKVLPITGKYMDSPVTAGVYANGYPQHSLYTFKSLFVGDYPELDALTDSEYQYATQLAIWASLGQLGIAGTTHTDGLEAIDQPSGDAQQERVFRAVQCLLLAGDEWDRVYQTGAYIRLEHDTLGGNLSIPADMSLETAANSEQYGIKRETIGGKVYYTRTYYVASATSTYYNNYNVELWLTGAPSGTIITYPGTNEELPHGTFRDISTWSTPTAYNRTNLNANEYEYVAQIKLAIPADSVSNAGEITLHMGTYNTQYDIYLCQNTDYTEQSYIIADPSQGVIQNEAVLSWGSDITLTGTLIVLKVDGGANPLTGAHFVLTGTDGTTRTGVSDAAGKVKWEQLDPAVTYTLSEAQAPAGYGIISPMNITVEAARDNYVTVRDDVNKRFTLRKIDKQTGYSLQGAVIIFEQIDGNFQTEKATDHAGLLSFTADELPVGDYRIYEKTPPKGYEKTDEVKTVHWDGLHDMTVTMENARKQRLVIYKCSEGNTVALPGCTLDVFKNGEFITSVTTNDTGLAYVNDVTSGYWTVKERIPPEGYALNTKEYSIKIENYDTSTTDDPRIVVEDKELPTLRLVKYDRTSLAPMAGIKFNVTCDGVDLGDFTTNALGEILVTGHQGTFLVTELQTDDDHLPANAPQQIVLHAGDGTKTIYFFNSVKPGMHLVKLDVDDLSHPVSGAKFRFEMVDGSWGPQELTTGEDGTIDLSQLPTGAMVVTEVECAGYVVDSTPRIVELKPDEDIELVFTNRKAPTLKLTKTSADGTALAGVTFRLAYVGDSAHYFDQTTDANGEIVWTDLHPGMATVKELSTLETHILDPKEYQVELVAGQESTITLSNDRRPNLTILKKDADTGEVIPGTVFTVQTASGQSVTEVTTGADGKALLPNVLPGTYRITEKSVPSGWLLDAEPQLVTLYPNRDSTVTFLNHQQPTITVRKVSSVTGDPLAGAKFHVTYASNHTSTGEIRDLGDHLTDANGSFTLKHQQDGWYKITELESVPGYSIGANATQEFYLAAGGSKTLTFENVPLSALVVYKFDSVTGAALPNCVFQVKALTDTSGTGGTVIGTYKTSANGSFTVTGLKAGTYIVEELASDGSHVIDTAPQTVYLSGKDQDVVSLYFGNTPKGGVLVKKVDAITHAPLSDTEFFVTDSQGAVIGSSNGKYVTASDGTFLIDDLDPGTSLVIRESRAKAGYVLDDTPQTVQVRPGQIVTVEFRDMPNGNLIIEKYDKVTGDRLAGATFKITYADGKALDSNEGQTSSNGLYTTGQDGTITISNVEPSTLVVTEVTPPKNYKLDPTPQTVVVNGADTQTLRFFDPPLCTLTISKRDAATKKYLANAEFTVRYSDGTVIGPNNGRYVTGKDGTVTVSGLTPDATVVVTETKAPTNYIKSDEIQSIVVHSGVANGVTFYNEPMSTLVIHKYIEGTHNEPLAGVAFKITDGNGGNVGPDTEYYTDKTGTIRLAVEPGMTVKVQETKTVEGYVLDGTPQEIQIKSGYGEQELTFWNSRAGTLKIVKLDSVTKERISGAKFELRYADGRYVDDEGGKLSSKGLYTTDRNGQIVISGITGTVVATELEPAEGYAIDEGTRTQTVTVNPNDTQTLTFYNKPLSGIEIFKYDSTTGSGIYGATFMVYDAGHNPVTEITTNQAGYARVEDLTEPGSYYLKELSCKGYQVTEELREIKVSAGETTHVKWANTPITGQIQVYKYAAAYNDVTGTAAGTPLQGAVYEIVQVRSGAVVGQIVSDARGVAASAPLPLDRYQLREVSAPAYWQLSDQVFDVTLEYPGQILKLADYDKPAVLGVSITKTGLKEVLAGDRLAYRITVANTSNVALDSFYWHDKVPYDVTSASMLTTGTYSHRLSYRVLYKTNYNDYRELASDLLTTNNYSFQLNGLPLMAGEVVTDLYFDFGTVPVGFQSVVRPTFTVAVSPTATNGYNIINRADVGGTYCGTWQTAHAGWVTIVRNLTKPVPLPKTGY